MDRHMHTGLGLIKTSILFASLCAAGSAAAQNTQSHALTIAAWYDDGAGGGGTSTNFSEADADTMYAAANNVVQNADQTGDESCDHTFLRSGTVLGIHGKESDGDISSEKEYAYVNNAATFIKVVPQITYCNGFLQSIGGCSPQNGLNSIVLAEWAVRQNPEAGVVMAHEYGHAVNLDHELYQIFNFMQEWSSVDNRNVNALQCPNLRSDHLDGNGPGSNFLPLPTSAAMSAPAATYLLDLSAAEPTIEELAQQVFLHVPLDLEATCDGADLEALLEMLRRGVPEIFEPTIAMLVGVLAREQDDAAAATLFEFAESHFGTVASRTAIVSLGQLAERGSILALNRLLDYAAEPRSFNASSAIVGLGLSGRPEARAALEPLLALSPTTQTSLTRSVALISPSATPHQTYSAAAPVLVQRETVEAAFSANQTIAASGRHGYYGR